MALCIHIYPLSAMHVWYIWEKIQFHSWIIRLANIRLGINESVLVKVFQFPSDCRPMWSNVANALHTREKERKKSQNNSQLGRQLFQYAFSRCNKLFRIRFIGKFYAQHISFIILWGIGKFARYAHYICLWVFVLYLFCQSICWWCAVSILILPTVWFLC